MHTGLMLKIYYRLTEAGYKCSMMTIAYYRKFTTSELRRSLMDRWNYVVTIIAKLCGLVARHIKFILYTTPKIRCESA